MKKFILGLIVLLFPLITFADQTKNSATFNQQVLNTMTQIRQQQTQIQQQLILLQQKLLILQQQQLILQKTLLIHTNNMVSKNFKWITTVPMSNIVLKNRINAGLLDGPAIYICHAKYANLGVHPGTLTPNGCKITYAGKVYVENQYQVLTGTGKISWRPSNSLQPDNRWNLATEGVGPIMPFGVQPQYNYLTNNGIPIVGGHERGQDIYICRTIMGNHLLIGKIVAGNCNIPYDGVELRRPDYQVLFAN